MKLLYLTLAAATAFPAPALASTVTIDLSGIRQGTGDLFVSLQTADQFMKPTGSYGEVIAKPAPGTKTVVLEGVAPGTYAVSVWHDVNGNGKWDGEETVGKDGPLDGWAMVNADKLRAEPKFEQVSFAVGAEPQTLKLGMRYGYGR